MNEKSKRLWQITVISAINLALLIILSVFNAEAARLGDSGKRIAQVQQRLYEINCYSGKINGIFDFKTRQAVSDFQSLSSIEKSGEANYETLLALGLDSRCGESFSASAELLARCIQLSGCRSYPEMLEKSDEILAETNGALTLGKYISSHRLADDILKTEPSDDAYNAAILTLEKTLILI